MRLLVFIYIFVASISMFDKRADKQLLNAIDQTCADTWCEGDFKFEFTKCSIHGDHSFTLDFLMVPRDCAICDRHAFNPLDKTAIKRFGKATKDWQVEAKRTNKGYLVHAVIRQDTKITGELSDQAYQNLCDAIEFAEKEISKQ